MPLTFDKINDLTGVKGVIGTDLLGSSRIRDNLSIGKNLTVTEKISLNGTINGSSVLDDDTFATATDTTLATTESIKAYVDAQVDTADTLTELNDTTIASSPADNELLAYDTSSSKWINQTATEAGLDLSLYLPLAGGTLTGDIDMGDNDISEVKSLAFQDGGATVTQVTDSDSLGTSDTVLCTQGNVKAYSDTNQYHYIRGALDYNQSGGTQVCIPLDGGTRPKTGFENSSESVCMIAPFDGTIEKILFRSEEVAGNPVVMGFHKVSDGTEAPSMTATVSEARDMSAAADDTSTEFVFTSSNTFSAGDVLGFTCNPANDINDCMFMVVLKYDTTAGI